MSRSISGICNALLTRTRLLRLKYKHSGRIRFEGIQHFASSAEMNITHGAEIFFGRGVYLRKGCSLKVRENAKLELGAGVMLNNDCIIGCHDRITVGDGTVFGPGVYLYDHDHDYRGGLHDSKYYTSPIVIGKNCWIGAGTIILRGTQIGDNCVVGAGCVLKGEYPANQLIVQKRETTVKAILPTSDNEK